MLYRGDQILRGFDDDLRDHVAEAMRGARHRASRSSATWRAIERAERGLRVTLDNGEAHLVDQVLFATGRDPNTAGLGLEALGRRHRARTARSRWTTGRRPRCRRSTRSATSPTGLALTPVAIREGQAFAETVFGGAAGPARPRADPDRGLHPARGRHGRR